MLGFLRSFVGGKIRVENDETVMVVRALPVATPMPKSVPR